MQGVTLAQLEALAARYTGRSSSHTSNRAGAPPGDVYSRARAYLANTPPAISGTFVDNMKGQDRTIYTAGRLVRGFDLTPDQAYPLFAEWNQRNAPNDQWSERDLRRKLEEAAKRPGPRGFLLNAAPPPPGHKANHPGVSGAAFKNYTVVEIPDGETTRTVRRGRRGPELVEELVEFTGGWPRRVGSMLFARDRAGGIMWITRVSELFAWIDWQYSFNGGKGFDWVGQSDTLTKEDFLHSCRQHCEHWDQVELYPHEPPLPNHYYHHPEIPAGDGKHLGELVRRFRPDSPEDEDLIRLFFVTLVWGGPQGKVPLFVFESSKQASDGGRGAGKTIVPRLGSQLVGGAISLSATEQLRDIHARFLSPAGLVKRIALIDNLKSARYGNSDLEGLITSSPISGRQLYTGEGQRPNTLLWVVTSNEPSLSKDLAQRSVIIRVTTPVYDPDWLRDAERFIEEHRWKIIGDCIAELRQPTRLSEDFRFTRWSEWERDVLGRGPEPEVLAKLIAERRGQVDVDDDTGDAVLDAVAALVRERLVEDPATTPAYLEPGVLAATVSIVIGTNGKATADTLKRLTQMRLPGLAGTKTRGRRLWEWRPQAAGDKVIKYVITATSFSAKSTYFNDRDGNDL